MSVIKKPGVMSRLAGIGLMLGAPAAMAEYGLNLPRGVTSISTTAYDLHMMIFWICVVIGVIVFSAMFVSIVLHRKSQGHEAAQFTHSTKAEVVWTIIPVLILVVMAVPATTALINMEVAPETEMTVKITGFQWRWKYEYIEDDVSFISSLDPDSNAARRLESGTNPADIDRATQYVPAALARVMSGEPVTNGVTRPYGCSVKY